MSMNHREFSRVTVAVRTEIRFQDGVVHGLLENLSFNGALVRCEALIPVHTSCLVLLHLQKGATSSAVKARGWVVRHEPPVVAVQFTELIGRTSVRHLRNLVLYNSGSQLDRIEWELETHVGLRTTS